MRLSASSHLYIISLAISQKYSFRMAISSTPLSGPANTGIHDDKALFESVVEKGKAAEDDSDTNSELKQDGVKQVEAVTQAWSPAMMWLVFVLYVYRIDRPHTC